MQNAEPVRALVLAGGGAKGSYQIGVWRALQELGWQPAIITGASVGTLNVYAGQSPGSGGTLAFAGDP